MSVTIMMILLNPHLPLYITGTLEAVAAIPSSVSGTLVPVAILQLSSTTQTRILQRTLGAVLCSKAGFKDQ